MSVTCGVIRSGPNCAYLVLPREMHVDILSSKFPLTELFTFNYADQLRGSHLSLCCLYGDQPNPETSRRPVRFKCSLQWQLGGARLVGYLVFVNVTSGRVTSLALHITSALYRRSALIRQIVSCRRCVGFSNIFLKSSSGIIVKYHQKHSTNYEN